MSAGFLKNDFIKLALFTALACIMGACLRFEQWFDFFNYHYYNAYAFLNNRLGYDIIPAFVNTFFSPFIELPSYFLVNLLNEHPVIYSVVMAVPYGFLLFITFKIICMYFDTDGLNGKILAGTALFLSISGENTFSQISTTTHEIPLAFLVLCAFYMLLKDIAEKRLFRKKTYMFSGFLLGAAAGLKLTFGLYAAATGITLVLFYRHLKKPKTLIVLFTAAGIAGFLITHGYWSWILWKNYQNPLFPFYNGIFRSPFWAPENYADMRYFDKPLAAVFFYPVLMFFNYDALLPLQRLVVLSNFRFLPAFFFLIVFIGRLIFARFIKKEPFPVSLKTAFLLTWLTVIYVIWLSSFRVLRYLVPFEMLLSIPLIAVLLKGFDFHKNRKGPVFFPLVFFILTTLVLLPMSNWRRPVDENLLPAEKMYLPDHSLLVMSHVPSAIFIPLLAENPTVRAVIHPRFVNKVNGTDFHMKGTFNSQRTQLMREHFIKKQGPLVFLSEYNPGLPCTELAVIDGVSFSVCIQEYPSKNRRRSPAVPAERTPSRKITVKNRAEQLPDREGL